VYNRDVILARSALVAMAFALVCAGQAAAATKVVSFDDLPPGTEVTTQYESSHGVYWQATDNDFFPVIKAAPGAARSGDRVLDISECFSQLPNCEGYTPRTIGRLRGFARTVTVYAGFLGSNGISSQVTLTAFNAGGATVGTATTTVTQGQPFTTALSVTSPNVSADIASFDVHGDQGMYGIGFDDLTIAVPDPAPDEPPPPPDFSMSVGNDPANVRQSDYVDVPVSIGRLNGSNGDVLLSASGLPPGMSATFIPNPVPGTGSDATLRLAASRDAPPSPYTEITITATPGEGAGTEARTAKALVRVVENCERTVRLDFVDARGTRCMVTAGPDRVAAVDQTLRLNGLALTPEDGRGSIVINKATRTISSEGTDVSVTPIDHPHIELYDGTIDWNLGAAGDAPKTVVDTPTRLVVGNDEEPIIDVFFGLRVERIAVALTKAGTAEVRPTIKLGGFWPFSYFGAVTTTTGFSTSNDGGSNFNALTIKLDRVTALGVELKNVSLGYAPENTWQGAATVVLRFAKAYEVAGAFGLKDGGFDYLRGSVSGLNVAVSPGVFLQRIGFGVQRDPLSLEGNARFSAGPTIKGVQLLTIDGALKAVLDDPFVVELRGLARLFNRFDLANAFVRYTSTGLFEIGGDINWDLKVAYVKGSVYGFVDGFDAASIEGRVRGCIGIPWAPDPCAGGAIIASNIGIAACIDIAIAQAGIGYFWGDEFDLFWGSCDLSRWRPAQGAGARAAATRRFRLGRGLPSAAFAIEGEGEGAAPGVTLRGPRGERISVSAAQPKARSGRLFAVQAGNGTTYILVRRPSAGVWRLVDDGAVPIRRIRQAFGLPRPSVKAEVAGRGTRRTLSWRLRPIRGQRVRFVEIGGGVRHLVATTRSAHGVQRFRPAPGRAGRRKIVALVEQDALPRTTIDVASYRAPGGLRPGKPQRARIQRRGTRLLISWRAPRPGFRHAVHVALSDGRAFVRIARAGARSTTVRGVPPAYGAVATISGMTQANGRGPSARATIDPAAARPAAGRWALSSPVAHVASGRLTVARDRRSASDLRVTPGAGAAPGCGTAELRVKGRRRLVRATRAGLGVWIVGRPAPDTLEGATPVAVTALRGTERLAGTLRLVFEGRRSGTGELELPSCRMLLALRR
jgi:hypothetical protein